MELRSELMPPVLDETLVARLAKLAAHLDGARPGECDDELDEFNHLSGIDIPLVDFQGIYGAEGHENWVRRMLLFRLIKPASGVTREELAEVVRRAMPQNEFFDQHEGYMAVFNANVPLESASGLIFYPSDYDPATNTWDGGRPMGEYDPSPEQIVEWALSPGASK